MKVLGELNNMYSRNMNYPFPFLFSPPSSPDSTVIYNENQGDLFAGNFSAIRSNFSFQLNQLPTNNKIKKTWDLFSCMQKNVIFINRHMMKRKKRFETMRKLLEIDEMPWDIRFKPKQQEEICLEERRYEEEQQAPSPGSKFSEHKLFHPTLRVGAKKPSQSRSRKRRMVGMHDLCGQIKVTSSVMQRAEAVQETLEAKFPSFVKPMIRSNVKKGFWLSLPRLFCKLHLPDHDTTIVLEDENRKEYITKYLAQRRGLSAGWMGFSIAHKLVEGDVLVFHMVNANKLKVYIIRSSRLAEVDAALCLLQLEGPATGNESGHRGDDCRDPQPTGEKSKSSSQPECEDISDKDMLDNNLGLVMGRPESIDEHLQLALEGRRVSFSGLHNQD